MSVPKGERSESTLQVLNLSHNLTVYTVNKCKNEKFFPKRQRWIIADRIINSAMESFVNIRKANSVLVRTMGDFTLRRRYQNIAHSELNSIYSLLDVLIETSPISPREIEHWSMLVKDTDDKLKLWMRSDNERYKEIINL